MCHVFSILLGFSGDCLLSVFGQIQNQYPKHFTSDKIDYIKQKDVHGTVDNKLINP
jgi:hypothetical protein